MPPALLKPQFTCERCGAPTSEVRHYPGPIPYSSAWCDRCYRIVGLTWMFRSPIGFIYFLVFVTIAGFVGTIAFLFIEALIQRLSE